MKEIALEMNDIWLDHHYWVSDGGWGIDCDMVFREASREQFWTRLSVNLGGPTGIGYIG